MAITYQTLYNETLSTIKSSCLNVSNYSALPSAYKAGYYEQKTWTFNHLTYYTKCTINNPVPQISASQVENDFKNFMGLFGINPYLSKEVTARGAIGFYGAVANFISRNVCYVQGRNQAKCLCYYRYWQGEEIGMETFSEGILIKDEDVNNTCGTVLNIIGNNARRVPMTYSFSFW